MRYLVILMLLAPISRLAGQVNLQTGSPQINFPLFSIGDANNGLSTSISLDYVGGNGIRVDDIASCVGTGWALSVGGSIRREQNGEPDDQKQRTTYQPLWTSPNYTSTGVATSQEIFDHRYYVNNYYPNGYLYSEYSPSDLITNYATYTYRQNCRTKDLPDPRFLADRQMDLFVLDFNGRQCKFHIGRGQNSLPVLFLNEKDKNLKVEIVVDDNLINQNIRTTIKSFIITDEAGIRYVFEDMELTEVIKYEKLDYYNINGTPHMTSGQQTTRTITTGCTAGIAVPWTGSNAIEAVKGVRTGQFTCNKWMLTKIVNPLTGKSIQFEYSVRETVIDGNHECTKSVMDNNPSYSLTVTKFSSRTKMISRIFNENNEEIQFNYGIGRQDLPNTEVLDNITYRNHLTSTGKVGFTYKYFYQNELRAIDASFTDTEKPYLRLCLTGLVTMDPNNAQNTRGNQFDYYTGTSGFDMVPPMFCFYKDYWGYFNTYAAPGTNMVPPIGHIYSRDVYWNAFIKDGAQSDIREKHDWGLLESSSGMIKSIKNPLGGLVVYEYENNFANVNGVNKVVGGVRVKKVATKEDAASASVSEVSYNYTSVNGLSSGWGYEAPVYTKSTTVVVWNCSSSGGFPVNYVLNSALATSFNFVKSGGVLVESVFRGNNFVSKTSGRVFTDFTKVKQVNPIVANGIFSIASGIILQGIIASITDFFSDPSKEFQQTTVFSTPINFSNALPIQYARVQVSNSKNSIYLGKEVYTFTSNSEYPIEVATQSLYSPKQRMGDWKYGLVKQIESFDKNNSIIRKSENIYDPVPIQHAISSSEYKSQFWEGIGNTIWCNPSTYNGFLTNHIASEVYYPFTGAINLNETKEYIYNPTGTGYTMNTKQFGYNSDYFLASTIMYSSKGEKQETLTQYVNDYSVSGTLATMKQNNMIALPVLSESYIWKNGNTDKYLVGGSITEYGTLSNNNIKPVGTYVFRNMNNGNPVPVLNSSIAGISPTQWLRDQNYYKKISSVNYNVLGAPIEINTETSKKSTLYSISYPSQAIATVINASRNDVAYTSFEESSELAGITDPFEWYYPTNAVYREDGFSGNACMKFGGKTGTAIQALSRINLDPLAVYRLTFWAKNLSSQTYTPYNYQPFVTKDLVISGTPFNNNISTHKLYTNPVTGWALYECEVSGTSFVAINNQDATNNTVGFPILVDEVRIYPKNAQMSTAAFNIIGLQTAAVDANDRIAYTEYDFLGRPTVIRDEKRNIIKTFEYHYKN